MLLILITKYCKHVHEIQNEILKPLDLPEFEVYVECIKGKRTNIRKLGVERVKDVLELIHVDICGPFPTTSWNEQQYFIIFINDYSSLSTLKLNFNLERKLKLSNLIMMVNTMENNIQGRLHFFSKCRIVLQYTMLGKPNMNGYVRSMISDSSSLLESLWREALKTIVYILNKVPSKVVNKILYELWTNKMLSIKHLHIWDCPTKE
ncbi:hypothetical protein CR513_13041, partial [Mucuna pruriens]